MTVARPTLRPGVAAAVDEDGRLRLIRFARALHHVYEVEPPVVALVALLDGTRTPADLLTDVRVDHPGVQLDDVHEVLDALAADDLLEDAADTAAADGLGPVAGDVYARQLDFLAEFGRARGDRFVMQAELRAAHVAVLGLGGTGSWIAQSLALAGVGRLRLVDGDMVEPSNLSRQPPFARRDVGARKAAAAARTLGSRYGALCVVEGIDRRLHGPADVAEVVAGCDLVVNCMDEPDINTTAQWVADACLTDAVPHIIGGGYDGHVGLLGLTVVPGRTACWTCVQTAHFDRWPPAELAYLGDARRKHSGAFAPLAAVVTNLQVWDAVRVLTGCGAPLLADRLGELDFTDLSVSWTPTPRRRDCPSCGALVPESGAQPGRRLEVIA